MSHVTGELAVLRAAQDARVTSKIRASVLVVDDHPPNLLAVEAILEPLGYPLVMVRSGDEALRHLLHEECALILLDVQMAGLDGFETAKLIKGQERTRHIPIIFLTAVHRDAEYIFRGYEHGAVDYLLKPIEPEHLRAKVRVFVDLYLQGEKIKRQAALLAESVARYEDERRARATAEAARCAREEALAVVSHDLRTPLSTISMIAESILANAPTTEDDRARHVKGAATIVRATDQMARLINDLLDVARIEAGRLSFERTPHTTDELIVQVLDMLQPLAVQAGMQLTVVNEVEGARVQCDPDRIFQVFSNLVGNAIKFDRPNGTVAIHARAAGTLVEFSVSDDGPGIPPEQLPHIFERYWQARARDRQGVGLGLAIVKGIVEAHGGTIAVRSSSETGTTFTFTIPIASG